MARESSIDDDDNWFVGEHKLLRFTIAGVDTVDDPVTDWAMRWRLFNRGAEPDAEPLVEKTTAAGVTAVGPTIAQVEILADDTAELPPLVYQYVLSRTDAGAEAVLAYGPAALRSAIA